MTNLVVADLRHDASLDADALSTVHGGAFLGQEQFGPIVNSGITFEDTGFSLFSPTILFAPTFAISPQIQVGLAQDFTTITASQIIEGVRDSIRGG